MSIQAKPVREFGRPLRLTAKVAALFDKLANGAASAPRFSELDRKLGSPSSSPQSGSRLPVPPRAGGVIMTSAVLLLGILALAIGGWRTSRDLERATDRELAATAGGSPAITTDSPSPTSAIAPLVSSRAPKYRTRPIGELRTGQRVQARNPQLDPAEVVSSEIDPATWRNVRLRMQKSTGGQLDIVLLRPVDWLHENGIDERSFSTENSGVEPKSQAPAICSVHGELPAPNLWPWHSGTRATSRHSSEVAHLFAGSDAEAPTWDYCAACEFSAEFQHPASIAVDEAEPRHTEAAQLLTTLPQSTTPTEPPSHPWIFLDLAEIGASGPAEVLAIEPCPEIEPGLGQIVTGTFAHSAANVIDVAVDGLAEPIGCTANDLFWSEDRQDFVPAGTLQPGENLRTESGTLLRVTRITPRRGPPVGVFNLEIDAQHVYVVSSAGLLVHNSCPDPSFGSTAFGNKIHASFPKIVEELTNGRVAVPRVEPGMTVLMSHLLIPFAACETSSDGLTPNSNTQN